jgi:hypothetical protein
MKRAELILVIGLLAVSATLVSGSLHLPPSAVLLLASPITKVLLVAAVVYAFIKSPTVGIAAIVTVAVLLFTRNITLVSSEGSFLTNWMNSYMQSDSTKDMLDPAPAPDSYPTDRARPEGSTEDRSYSYRPTENTGSDEFTRFGPEMDEKVAVLH